MLTASCMISMIAAVLTAAAIAYRRRDHALFAVLLAGLAVGNVVALYLDARFALLDGGPFVGAARVAFHFDEALEVGGSAALGGMAVWYFARRRWFALLAAPAWVLVLAFLVTSYPALRG